MVKIIDNIVEENRETEMDEILKIVKGPDFPTGATILGTRGIEEAYRTGRGKIRVRGGEQYRDPSQRKEPDHGDGAAVHGQQGPSD